MTNGKQRWWRLIVFPLIAAGLLMAGLRAYRGDRKGPDLPTAPVRSGDFRVIVRTRGELKANRNASLHAPRESTDLQIVWLAPPNVDIHEGDPVIRFDPSRMQQDLKEKQAALKQAQSALDQAVAQSRITSDQDNMDLSQAGYDAEKARLETTRASVVSVMQGQQSAIDFKVAQEKVKVQQATAALHSSSDQAKLASLKRLRDQAQLEVELTQQQLAQIELKSPFRGVVSYQMNYSQGWENPMPYKVGDRVYPGVAIAEVPDLSTLEMVAKLEEIDRGMVHLGDEVLVHVDALPERTFSAKLSSVSALTEQSFIEWPPVRSFRAYATLSPVDPSLRPGMQAGADFVRQTIHNATSIPAKALFTLHTKPVVYVKTEGKFAAREVQVIARNPDEIAVTGVSKGMEVALSDIGTDAGGSGRGQEKAQP
jgi:HlyD family secretion protein